MTFLKTLAEVYEIVIFTASTKAYADYILNMIDSKGIYIQHRLYREHTDCVDDVYHKDLSKLGRQLSRTIIVDNLSENF